MRWLDNRAGRRAEGASRRRRGVPTVEICEDRTLPTAFFVDNNADDGPGSLRRAILDANADATDPTDTIEFRSGATAIALATPLPPITAPVVVNSTGRADVSIDGGGALDGFTLASGSDGSTIQGLTIRNFAGAAILVRSDGNAILGNTLGAASGGVGFGVLVDGGGGNEIGRPGSGNTIGFATGAGVRLLGAGATGNLVRGNFIGVGASGQAIGNAYGVQVFNAPGNTIGGAGGGNRIGNSSAAGVLIAGAGASGNVVAANTIGTTPANAAAPNAYGVQINNAPSNRVGGVAGQGNTIDASTGAGVQMFGAGAVGNAVVGNAIGGGAGPGNAVGVEIQGASGNSIGEPGRGNVIAGNAQRGVAVLSGDRNTIRENEYRANGPAVGGTRAPADSLFLATGSNQGVVPARLQSASQGLSDLILVVQLDATYVTPPEIEVYRIGATTAEYLGRSPADFTTGLGVATLPITGLLPNDRLAVTITGDLDEGSTPEPGDGTSAFSNQVVVATPNVVTNTDDSGEGSLRGAVEYVSSLPADADRSIIFRISDESREPTGEWVIFLSSDILIPSQVYIDGWDTEESSTPQPGTFLTPSVWLTPATEGPGAANGLVFQEGSENSLVRGLGFLGFTGSAVEVAASGVQVVGNLIFGTRSDDDPRLGIGVSITGGSGTLIGGLDATTKNGIAGLRTAVQVAGPGSNYILGNEVGTNGFVRYRNIDGISIVGSPGNLVRGNLIGANRFVESSDADPELPGSVPPGGFGAGVRIAGAGATGNRVAGNTIGFAPFPEALTDLGNDVGVYVDAPGNTVGSLLAGGQGVAGTENVIGQNVHGLILTSAAIGNVVAGNFIGVDPSGRNLGNTLTGVWLQGARSNAIGRAPATLLNVIGRNGDAGIRLDAGAADNSVENNLIGTTIQGTAIPNGWGILLGDSARNLIGPREGAGPSPWDPTGRVLLAGANVISGNSGGVYFQEGSRSNRLRGNVVGAYLAFPGNEGEGVAEFGGSGDLIGGGLFPGVPTGPTALVPGVANVIAGNFEGVSVGEPSSDVLIAGNWIHSNRTNGVRVQGDMGGGGRLASVLGNFIGTTFDGSSILTTAGASTGNGLNGVLLNPTGTATSGADWSVILASNLISGNVFNGVLFESPQVGDVATLADDQSALLAKALIVDNIIGLNLAGSASDAGGVAVGNGLTGVRLVNVGGARIGRLETGSRAWSNVISGNEWSGVEVLFLSGTSSQGSESLDVRIVKNVIGGDLEGRIPQGAGAENSHVWSGVFVSGDVRASILANRIVGNRGPGVYATDFQRFEGRLLVDGNEIGTSATGEDLGNTGDGVLVTNLIPPDDSGGRELATIRNNLIGANGGNGINVQTSYDVGIRGNLIGSIGRILANSSQDAGNQGHGVLVNFGSRVAIGGAAPGDGNIISGNRGIGVILSAGDGNAILGNLIGVGADGSSGVGNQDSGIVVSASSGNVIGVDRSGGGVGNLVSGNRLYGILIVGGGFLADGNVVAGNRIGTNLAGAAAVPNLADGLFLLDASNTTVGGTAPAARNVISGNRGQGVRIQGAGAVGNVLLGNFIGLDASGAGGLGNGGSGVVVSGASGLQIGGTGEGQRNWISANGQSGVLVSGPPLAGAPPTIFGNTIGLDRAGGRALGNGGSGVQLVGASGVQVGYNVISANAGDGVQVFSPAASVPADRNWIFGNFVGTNGDGTEALGNRGVGVNLVNGHGNVVGGESRNVVSGNGAYGVVVEFQGARGFEGAANVVAGNLIGLDRTGSTRVGNGLYGVLLNNAVDTVIGYATGAAGFPVVGGLLVPAPGQASNVISGNGAAGVVLTGTTTGTRVRGSFIGVDAQGRAFDDAGAGLDLFSRVGVLIESRASNNWIGGLIDGEEGEAAGTGNIITQSARGAVRDLLGVQVVSSEALGNRIQSNLIGLDAQGRSGSNAIGVLLADARDVRIGGYRPKLAGLGPPSSSGNVITGNATAGVEISGPLATANLLVNNFIGTDASGLDRPAPRIAPTNPLYDPSQESGVLIVQASGNTVGAPNAGNLISGNRFGVNIASLDGDASSTSRNVVQGNTIGTDATGLRALPNFQFGVFVTAAAENAIDSNLISANGLAGIQIFGGGSQLGGGGAAASLGNTITANRIGVDAAGRVAFAVSDGSQIIDSIARHPEVRLPDGLVVNYGFQSHGVVVIGSSGNRIGLPGLGNVISGNILTGVYISRRDNPLNVYGRPVDNSVQSNNLNINGVYGVYRYDAPNGNPVAEAPASDANSFNGTPIPIGDFISGVDAPSPQTQVQSILLGPGGGAGPRGPRRPPSRPRAVTSTSAPTTAPRPTVERPALARLAQAGRPR